MGLTEMIKSVSEVGVLIICGAIVLCGYISTQKALKKEKEELQEKYDGIIKTAVDSALKNNSSQHVLSAEEDRNTYKIEEQINYYLKEILITTNSSRISLIRYHNGGRDMSGLPFLKMSVTNEFCKRGIQPMIREVQGCFRSLFSSFCKEIAEKRILLHIRYRKAKRNRR